MLWPSLFLGGENVTNSIIYITWYNLLHTIQPPLQAHTRTRTHHSNKRKERERQKQSSAIILQQTFFETHIQEHFKTNFLDTGPTRCSIRFLIQTIHKQALRLPLSDRRPTHHHHHHHLTLTLTPRTKVFLDKILRSVNTRRKRSRKRIDNAIKHFFKKMQPTVKVVAVLSITCINASTMWMSSVLVMALVIYVPPVQRMVLKAVC